MTTATFTPNQTYTETFQEKLNWLEYQQGVALNPLLKKYAEEVDEISASDLMELNSGVFIAYLERIMAISYGMGIEYDDKYEEHDAPSPSRVIYPPIPKQWVKGLARNIIDWAGYFNGN